MTAENARRVVVATGNQGKLVELRGLLAPCGLSIVAGPELDVPEVEETGLTFVENALLKARSASTHTGLPSIADDSGLEVDALHGAPGVHSARFAGEDASDTDNLEKLLASMSDVPAADRSARFYCCVVYLRHAGDPTPLIGHGIWPGRIATSPAGSGGFGYDPVFLPDGLTCSSAELAPGDKNQLSHRARALSQLVTLLENA